MDSVRIHTGGVNYYDPEFLYPDPEGSGYILMTFQDIVAGDAWLGYLSPVTGLPAFSPDCRDVLIHNNVSDYPTVGKGPDLSKRTTSPKWLVWCNQTDTHIRVVRCVPTINGSTKRATAFTNVIVTPDDIDRTNKLASFCSTDAQAKAAYFKDPGELIVYDDADASETTVANNGPFKFFRWVTERKNLIFVTTAAGPTQSEIGLYDTVSRTSSIISSDKAVNGVHHDPYGWAAPEYGGQIAVQCRMDNDTIGIYVPTGVGSNVALARRLLAPASNPFPQSFEPFVLGNRSWVIGEWKKEDVNILTTTDAQVWVHSIDGTQAIRVDDGVSNFIHAEGETIVTAESGNRLFVYYQRLPSGGGASEIWLTRTDLYASDAGRRHRNIRTRGRR